MVGYFRYIQLFEILSMYANIHLFYFCFVDWLTIHVNIHCFSSLIDWLE